MIPVSQPFLDDRDRSNLLKAFDSGWISSHGSFLEEAEELMASVTGSRHALLVSNGTVALHLALETLGIGPGDEVIVPSFTYIASVNAIRYVGATPVFCDVDSKRWCASSEEISRHITPKTRAVLVVHLYGQAAEMGSIVELCKTHNLWLVEDVAEAIFGEYRDRPLGSFGDISTFSFFGNKVVTCGEGGAIVTNSQNLVDRARLLRGQGMDPTRRYFFPVVGHNFRLSNLLAGILLSQLEKREEILSMRLSVVARYEASLRGVDGLEFQPRFTDTKWSPWFFSVLVGDSTTREALASFLSGMGIETRPFFIPVHTMPPYEGLTDGSLPVTEELSGRGLNLPTFPSLSNEQVDFICSGVREFFSSK